MKNNNPNVLFVMCDDLNCSIEGLGRKPAVVAPNVNRIRRKGTTFTNAQNNSPVCVPSRDSLFSGIYPHQSGSLSIWDKWADCVRPITTASWSRYNGVHLLR